MSFSLDSKQRAKRDWIWQEYGRASPWTVAANTHARCYQEMITESCSKERSFIRSAQIYTANRSPLQEWNFVVSVCDLGREVVGPGLEERVDVWREGVAGQPDDRRRDAHGPNLPRRLRASTPAPAGADQVSSAHQLNGKAPRAAVSADTSIDVNCGVSSRARSRIWHDAPRVRPWRASSRRWWWGRRRRRHRHPERAVPPRRRSSPRPAPRRRRPTSAAPSPEPAAASRRCTPAGRLSYSLVTIEHFAHVRTLWISSSSTRRTLIALRSAAAQAIAALQDARRLDQTSTPGPLKRDALSVRPAGKRQ